MAELFLLRRRVGADRLPGPGVPHGHGGQRGHAHLPLEGVRRADARPDGRHLRPLPALPLAVGVAGRVRARHVDVAQPPGHQVQIQ